MPWRQGPFAPGAPTPSTPRHTSAVPGRASRTAWSCLPRYSIPTSSRTHRSRGERLHGRSGNPTAEWRLQPRTRVCEGALLSGAMAVKPVLVAWSGGKDSALALREILRDWRYRVAALLTTVTAEYDRISMHGVRRSLLRRQAESLGLPLEEVVISPGGTNDEYETNMGAALAALRTRISGLDTVVFGDLFLADIRAYRE